jgi:hypothetical protein
MAVNLDLLSRRSKMTFFVDNRSQNERLRSREMLYSGADTF